MDALEASKRGLPWCQHCEATAGRFVTVYGDNGMLVLCERCADPSGGDAGPVDNDEHIEKGEN